MMAKKAEKIVSTGPMMRLLPSVGQEDSDRIQRKTYHCVELFSDAHGPEFRGQFSPYPSGYYQGCKHGSEFGQYRFPTALPR